MVILRYNHLYALIWTYKIQPQNDAIVVNDKVYVVPWSITSGLEHVYGFVLLAKIFHPEIDIDPTEVYKEFLEEFLRVEYPEGKVLVYPPLPS